MSLIDTDQIWAALGDFYDLFPQEERVYWSTFWEAYADLTADLWGYAFQVDRAKSLFSTTPTIERQQVLVLTSNLVTSPFARFRISVLKQQSGVWILRGFVPRDLRDFKADVIPARGSIRIGVDVIDYTSVNIDSIVGGVFDGFVREATFVLEGTPPHDYADDPEFNDDFDPGPQQLKMRVDHIGGETVVDAVLVDPLDTVDVNPTGVLRIGVSGVNAEVLEYQSVTILGDRYLFQLPSSYQAPDLSAPSVAFSHPQDELLTVTRYDDDRWRQTTSGAARAIGDGALDMVIDNEPVLLPASVVAEGQYLLQNNVDFDVSVAVDIETWPVPPGTLSANERRVAMRLRVGAQAYVIGIETRRSLLGVSEEFLVHGLQGSETSTSLGASLTLPFRFQARMKRVGADLEFQYRGPDDEDFQLLGTLTVGGARASMDLLLTDNGLDTGTRVSFDEVIRRAGGVIGNQRLEEFFDVTETHPYTYDIDQTITAADQGLRDAPRLRFENMVVSEDVTDPASPVVRATAGPDFVAQGLPAFGVLEIGEREAVYTEVVVNDDVYEFQLRGKLDPDLIPLAAGTSARALTRNQLPESDFVLSGTGQVSFRELVTREGMWAPLAQVDYQHVQRAYGQLVDILGDTSTDLYLSKVQGVWFALMDGPFIANMRSGLQLTMGLPVAKIQGTVVEKRDEFDNLGRFTRRVLVVNSFERGEVEHDLNPDLFPFIDWSVDVGQAVDRFQPLTNGIEVLDFQSDPLWYQRFTDVSEVERFNSFGVFVALEALSSEASFEDAIRFALRIKPTYTKIFTRFLLTSGNEDLSDDLDDDTFVISVPRICEDMTFDEGLVPLDPDGVLRLGDGHKLGQGKTLGGIGDWVPYGLGDYVRAATHPGDATITAATGTLTSAGARDFTSSGGLQSGTGEVTAASDVFIGTGFSETDVGRVLVIRNLTDPFAQDKVEILAYISPTQVQVAHTYAGAQSGLDWLVTEDLWRSVFVAWSTDTVEAQIVDVLDADSVTLAATFPVTEAGLYWQLREYRSLGAGHTLGQYRAFKCEAEGTNQPAELVDATEIVNMAVGP